MRVTRRESLRLFGLVATAGSSPDQLYNALRAQKPLDRGVSLAIARHSARGGSASCGRARSAFQRMPLCTSYALRSKEVVSNLGSDRGLDRQNNLE
jgi:hypothetical protein